MSDLTPIRLEGIKESLMKILNHKQTAGDSEVEILQWLNKLSSYWQWQPQMVEYIHTIRLAVSHTGEIIRQIKENMK